MVSAMESMGRVRLSPYYWLQRGRSKEAYANAEKPYRICLRKVRGTADLPP